MSEEVSFIEQQLPCRFETERFFFAHFLNHKTNQQRNPLSISATLCCLGIESGFSCVLLLCCQFLCFVCASFLWFGTWLNARRHVNDKADESCGGETQLLERTFCYRLSQDSRRLVLDVICTRCHMRLTFRCWGVCIFFFFFFCLFLLFCWVWCCFLSSFYCGLVVLASR
jgi:hypothetical protein